MVISTMEKKKAEPRGVGIEWGCFDILDRVSMGGSLQRWHLSKDMKCVSQIEYLGRGYCQCKGPEVRTKLVDLRAS